MQLDTASTFSLPLFPTLPLPPCLTHTHTHTQSKQAMLELSKEYARPLSVCYEVIAHRSHRLVSCKLTNPSILFLSGLWASNGPPAIGQLRVHSFIRPSTHSSIHSFTYLARLSWQARASHGRGGRWPPAPSAATSPAIAEGGRLAKRMKEQATASSVTLCKQPGDSHK
jgi:hypothetical protein